MFLPAFLPFYMFNQVHNLDLIRDIYVGEIYHNLQIWIKAIRLDTGYWLNDQQTRTLDCIIFLNIVRITTKYNDKNHHIVNMFS